MEKTYASTMQSTDQIYRRRRRGRRSSLPIIAVLLFIVLGVFAAIRGIWNKEPGTKVTNRVQLTSAPAPNNLTEAVESALAGTTGGYSVVVKHLGTGESYMRDEHHEFEAASLYKLWIMGTVFDQIEKGNLNKDDVLIQDVKVLNRKFGIASESAEFAEGTVRMSVDTALVQMITISHNYAALLLSEKIKLSSVAVWLDRNGLRESRVGTDGSAPITTAADTALFFEKLTKGELVNSVHIARMIEILKDQRLNNKLPKYLPENTRIAHKTGEIGEFTHDVGIVYGEKGAYIIVAMSESANPAGAEERIATLSKAVFDYFAR